MNQKLTPAEARRKGGHALVQKYSYDSRVEWNRSGGINTRDMYGSEYYAYINKQRKVRRGWPKGKSRKTVALAEKTLHNASPVIKQVLEPMLAATRNGL